MPSPLRLLIQCLLVLLALASVFTASMQAAYPGEAGTTVRDIKLKRLSGEQVNLSTLLQNLPPERRVYLFVWASWCSYCKRELQFIAENAQAIKSMGMDVLTIALEGNAVKVNSVLETLPVKVPAVLDPVDDTKRAFLFTAVPGHFVLTKNRFVLMRRIGYLGPNLLLEQLKQAQRMNIP